MSGELIRRRYLWWALAAIAVMISAITMANLWLLNFIHVLSSLLWTGIDLFMGFVLGPILQRVDISVRREIVRRLTAALVLVTLMTIQGLGFLIPLNVLVCLELRKDKPDLIRIRNWMQRHFYTVATQGAMQVAIIVVMTRLREGI